MYQVLARKWRPQTFDDLVGQQTVTQTLLNSITSGRIAHAFLFAGPRGVGKTTCARVLAKALNCHSGEGPVNKPCGVCPSCQDIAASRSMDVLEIDGASNRGIDEVRELRDSAKYQAIRDRFRVFIIDEVHMLTTEAFNALLKILEEPPAHVFFIFATTEIKKVPETIRSRCQVHEFKKIPDRILVNRLRQIVQEEKIEISDRSLEMIAESSEGGLRDALGTLDQIIAFGGSTVGEKDVQTVLGLVDAEIMMEMGNAIADGDTAAVLAVFERITEYGVDYKIFYNELLSFYRDLFLARFSAQADDQRKAELAKKYDEVHLLRICHQLVSVQNLMKLSGNLRFLFEVTLVRLSQIKRIVPLEELAENLKKNSSSQSAPSVRPQPMSVPAAVPISRPEEIRKPMPAAPAAVPVAPVSPTATTAAAAPAQPMADDFFAVFISELESQNARLAAALEHARFLRNNSKFSFYVPDMYYGMVKWDARINGELEALLQRKLGETVSVEIKKGEPPQEKESVKVSTPETLVEGDPGVKEFVRVFKGKVGKIELNKERYQ